MPDALRQDLLEACSDCQPYCDSLRCADELEWCESFDCLFSALLMLWLSFQTLHSFYKDHPAFFAQPRYVPCHSIDPVQKLVPAVHGELRLDDYRRLHNGLVAKQFS